MPNLIVYDDDVINAVQPEVSAVKVGTTQSFAVDANLSQITMNGSLRYSCSDVNGLTLWSLDQAAIFQLFVNAGASGPLEPDDWFNGSFWLNTAGDKLIVFALGAHSGVVYIYVGVADINAVGVVAAPVLTDYIRMRGPGIEIYYAAGVWERREDDSPGTLVIMTNDFTTAKVQWHICPSVADIESGEFKGAHAGSTGTLATDEGPGLLVSWTHATAEGASYNTFSDGNVSDAPIGFMASNTFYFLVPRGWMENTDNGFNASWAATRPNGGVFTVDFGAASGTYANHSWPVSQARETVTVSTDATDVTDTVFTPAPPWTEEYTRVYDGASNGGWLATYAGRPAIHYPADGLPVLLFGIIDGNATYEDDLGAGERIFFAKVRGYKWTGTAFAQFDAEQGIVLRNGDLGFSGYNFTNPDSQHIYLIDGDIYFQICQWTGTGSAANSRSILTRFGRFIESETRQSDSFGRVRYVART